MEVREIIERRHQINVYLVHGKPRIYLTWLKSEIKELWILKYRQQSENGVTFKNMY